MTEVGPVGACRVPENRTFADFAERPRADIKTAPKARREAAPSRSPPLARRVRLSPRWPRCQVAQDAQVVFHGLELFERMSLPIGDLAHDPKRITGAIGFRRIARKL